MPLHMHFGRKLVGLGLGVLAMAPSILTFNTAGSTKKLSEVTGSVSYSGKPLSGMTLCLDSVAGVHSAYSHLQSDGAFRLINMTEVSTGVLPGRYFIHLYTHPRGPSIPAKYADPRTSEVELVVESDWNHFTINLQ